MVYNSWHPEVFLTHEQWDIVEERMKTSRVERKGMTKKKNKNKTEWEKKNRILIVKIGF